MHRPNPEWDLIAAIQRRAGTALRVPLGIGDDAALVRHPTGDVLVTTDMLMDGVDFVLGETPLVLVGRKCLAVNLSDIAAMAGQPTAAFISLALPKTNGREIADGLYAGLLPLAKEFDVTIAGGDTNSWNGPLVVNVTLLGEPSPHGPVRRDGAQVGDQVFVTGPLGGSLPSLRHCRFTPRVREALALHESVNLHAMIDLSDGLASDLGHIARASGVGITIDADRLPIHDDVEGDPAARVQQALGDGEDFELAFCVSAADGRKLIANPPAGVAVFPIGECTAEPVLQLRDRSGLRGMAPAGWQHQFE